MNTRLLHPQHIDKGKWDKLVSGSDQGSVFMETGFLDALFQNQWQGIVVEEDNEYMAIMPIYIQKKYGISYALQPYLTKYWGIAFKNQDYSGTYKEFSWKKKYEEGILKCIPALYAFEYSFNPGFDYPLPFYWNNYKLNTKYTFYIDAHLQSPDQLFSSYGSSLKTNIRKGQKNGIRIIEDPDIRNLLGILPDSHKSGAEIAPKQYFPWFEAIFNFGNKSGKAYSFTALNAENKIIGSSLMVCDHKKSYALCLVVHRDQRLSAAAALMLHEMILKSQVNGLQFDLYGSMLEPVESFDRHFGARPVPYLNISKKNKLLSFFY